MLAGVSAESCPTRRKVEGGRMPRTLPRHAVESLLTLIGLWSAVVLVLPAPAHASCLAGNKPTAPPCQKVICSSDTGNRDIVPDPTQNGLTCNDADPCTYADVCNNRVCLTWATSRCCRKENPWTSRVSAEASRVARWSSTPELRTGALSKEGRCFAASQ